MGWETVAIVVACYALGCLNAGYYIVRWRTGADVRTLGTGTAGARNAGRQLGRAGFVATLVLDLAKGAVAVALASWFDVGVGWQTVAMLAVVAGHIWPAQLGFRGGKGLATATGAMLVFDPLLLGCAAVIAGILVATTGRVTAPGLVGVAAVPVLALVIDRSGVTIAGTAALAAVVLFAHRANISQQLSTRRAGGATPGARSSVPRERPGDDQHTSDVQGSI